MIENGKLTDLNELNRFFRLTDDDKFKLRELESKWISLKNKGIIRVNDDYNNDDVNDFEDRRSAYGFRNKDRFNRFDKSTSFLNYYKDFLMQSRQKSQFNYRQQYPLNYYSINSSPTSQTNWAPNQRPNQQFTDYVYNLYFKTMNLGERCLTPNMEPGFCRLVEDCVLSSK